MEVAFLLSAILGTAGAPVSPCLACEVIPGEPLDSFLPDTGPQSSPYITCQGKSFARIAMAQTRWWVFYSQVAAPPEDSGIAAIAL